MKADRLFLYAGLSKERFKSIEPAIKKDNSRHLIFFSLITILVLFVLLLVSIPLSSLHIYRPVYMTTLTVCIVAYLMERLGSQKLHLFAMELYMCSLFFAGIAMGTLIDPGHVTGVYLAALFAVPELFTDRPARMNGLITLSVAAYSVMAWLTQTPEMFSINMSNVLPMWILSMCVTTYTMLTKVDRIALRSENRYLSKVISPDDLETVPTGLSGVVELIQILMTFHSGESLLHCKRVRSYARLLCRAYNARHPQEQISDNRMELIAVGAQLHDIGKIYIPDEILHKTTALTEEERAIVQDHAKIGARLIDHVTQISGVDSPVLHNIALYHHERWDGSGYPEKLKGDQIPLEAQLVSVAEVYDALTTHNYSQTRTHEAAMEMIMSGECGSFNPEMLECLKQSEADFRLVLDEYRDVDRVELLDKVNTKNGKSYWVLKRAFDIVASFMGIIVLSPLLLLIALWIKIDDPKSPVIFKQTRLGRHRKPFTMYKFRTMVPNAEALLKDLQKENEKDGPVFKIKKDPRITGPGHFLRKTSLDELPQLFNILKGDMTVVGPRPPLPSEVEKYSKYHEIRLSVTPGLTCLWQSHEARDDVPFEKWMDMDVAYIGSRSAVTDAKIIAKTFKSVLKGSGN